MDQSEGSSSSGSSLTEALQEASFRRPRYAVLISLPYGYITLAVLNSTSSTTEARINLDTPWLWYFYHEALYHDVHPTRIRSHHVRVTFTPTMTFTLHRRITIERTGSYDGSNSTRNESSRSPTRLMSKRPRARRTLILLRWTSPRLLQTDGSTEPGILAAQLNRTLLKITDMVVE
jgi:hypothetical protein